MRTVACVLVGALTFVGTGAWALYHELTSNISSDYSLDDFRPTPTATPEPAETTDAPPVDPRAGQDLNIVLIGSDSRGGENAAFGDEEGARSDTTILLHIPADRSRVEAISIPRDLLVDIPACQATADGAMSSPKTQAMFNAAFSLGSDGGDVGLGAICTSLTIEQLTGLHIDDYVVVDFVGFERMVDSIGGIPMCIPEPIDDRWADLVLDAGQQTLNGHDALGLARARKTLGDGSDISRIGRQQELLASLVRTVLAKDLVTDSYSLIQFLDAVTSSLTTSKGLGNPIQLAGLAMAVAPVGAGGVTFVTMPFDYAGNRVVANAQSEELWQRLRNDEPVNSAAAQTDGADATTAAAGTGDAGAGATAGDGDATLDGVGDGATGAGAGDQGTDGGAEPTDAPTDPWTVVTGTDGPVC